MRKHRQLPRGTRPLQQRSSSNNSQRPPSDTRPLQQLHLLLDARNLLRHGQVARLLCMGGLHMASNSQQKKMDREACPCRRRLQTVSVFHLDDKTLRDCSTHHQALVPVYRSKTTDRHTPARRRDQEPNLQVL